MAEYQVEPTPANVHGNFSREHKPILTIESGDTVVYRTVDAGWNVKRCYSMEDKPEILEYGEPDAKRGNGHCLCGPIEIWGAEPGMTLEIKIEEIKVGAWGWTASSGWDSKVNERMGTDKSNHLRLFWSLDAETMTAKDQFGHEIDLHPFMGVMGMPPNEAGTHSTGPPRLCGGNLDCKELVAGTSLFLPISVPGALFSVGDGHAAQGDGEASGTAIECGMDRVVLSFHVHPNMKIGSPRARVKHGWITLGLDEDLDEACYQALGSMLDLMIEQHPGLERNAALALASMVVDLRVTQVANGVLGVHAFLADGAIR